MSLFNSIFGSSEEKKESVSKVNWIPLQSMGQLDELTALSNEKPVLIFKHSTRCSISRFALKQFENEFDLHDVMNAYFLDLITYREISNEIAARFGVPHQSPQLILIKGGKAIYDTSHDSIDALVLKKYIA
ncbi:bacillithiol system protein YtxJ [Flavobacterium succinicans]|uniref:Bacillithiol system protein YtxJ n=1 Tax=Flavobacterium succinicans TaxID=29536 RepID=A0A1I4WX03_9FLAO|nr:bacillithiol system redox-active protein YtxJ [Flavobacterium succinicans]SFN18037.1 bacillithiol system protein YtxJ [Flavobacterium succinicans]